MTLYDPKYQTLAEHFLRDEPYTPVTASAYEARVRSLAAAIQEAVEAWMAAIDKPPAEGRDQLHRLRVAVLTQVNQWRFQAEHIGPDDNVTSTAVDERAQVLRECALEIERILAAVLQELAPADVKACDECDGRGFVIDAPANVLDGRAYRVECPACHGTRRGGGLTTGTR